MDACTRLARTANANRELPTFMILVVALVGLASPLQAQTAAADQGNQRAFVEGGVLTGGFGPDELLHRMGVGAEFGVLVSRGPTGIRTLRARIETLGGNGNND